MPDFYYSEIQQKRTGHFYRVEVYRTSGSAIGATGEELPQNAIIDVEGIEWLWEDLPIGLHKPLAADIQFLGKALPSTLVGWIYDPFLYSGNVTLYGSTTVTITYSLIVKIYMRFSTSDNWNLAWIGSADPSQDLPEPDDKGIITITLQDSLQAAMKMLSFADMEEADFAYFTANTFDTIVTKACYDFIWKTGGKWFSRNHSSFSVGDLWFIPWESVYARWETYIEIVWAAFIGMTTSTTGTNLSEVFLAYGERQRKQTYTNEPVPGAVISYLDVYRLTFVVDHDDAMLESYYKNIQQGYDTFYDYFVDVCAQSYRQCVVQYYKDTIDNVKVHAVRLKRDGMSDVATVDITRHADKPRIPPYAKILGAVEASTEFGMEDDIDAHEERSRFGRNDGGVTIPVVLTNTPPAIEGNTTLDELNASSEGTWRYEAFYYFEDPVPPIGSSFGSVVAIRCHSWQEYYADGESVPSAPTLTFVSLPIAKTEDMGILCWAQARQDQLESGPIHQLPSKLLAAFGEGGTTLKTSIPCDAVIRTDAADSGNLTLMWVPHLAKVSLDPSAHISWLSGVALPSEWIITKCTGSIREGRLDIEAWGEP